MSCFRSITNHGKVNLAHLATMILLMVELNAQLLTKKEVLVVYNSAIPASKKLADLYQSSRDIPESQLLGLELPLEQDISRSDFNTDLLEPLREHFDQNNLWKRLNNPNGLLVPTENRIRAIVLMRGVPLRISASPNPPLLDGEKTPTDPISPRNEASVDSELALFGTEGLPVKGVLRNAFFESDVPLSKLQAPYLVLVTRIDSPTFETCERMIKDSVETEKSGLWGRACVDIANKFPQGDEWMEEIVRKNLNFGIPTIVDRFNDSLPKNYPLTETALYYGWYDWNVSGPFLNPDFRFRPGAVAIHLHSFSAVQLADPERNWAGPLLARGAAATVGNVYEPYLHLSHHFDILHDRLIEGWTFAEAAWASMPVVSWQGVAIGDPLYRPFRHINGTGQKRDDDRDFRALRAASREWPDNDAERRNKIAKAAEDLESGNMADGLALEYLEIGAIPDAQSWFRKSQEFFESPTDKLRQEIQLAAIDRRDNRKQEAISRLRNARKSYGTIRESEAVAGWLDILDPPPPPIADPSKLIEE